MCTQFVLRKLKAYLKAQKSTNNMVLVSRLIAAIPCVPTV